MLLGVRVLLLSVTMGLLKGFLLWTKRPSIVRKELGDKQWGD